MAVELILTPDEACLEVIRRAPETCAKVYADYRRALLRRFPYAIFYEYAEAVITVYGILHTSQDPAKWRDRLA